MTGSRTSKSHDKSHDKSCKTGFVNMKSFTKTGCEILETVESNFEEQTEKGLTGSASGADYEKNNTHLQTTVKTSTKFNTFDFVSSDSYDSQRRDNRTDRSKDNYLNNKDEIVDTIEHVPTFCMVGLHCCGDLTPIMLQNFTDLDHITSLCCVSCCYHRMNFNGLYLLYFFLNLKI